MPPPSDHAQDVAGRGADRHAQPDLARALAHGVGHDAVEADRGQKQRDAGEERQQQHRESPLRDRLADDRRERRHRDTPAALDRARARPGAPRPPSAAGSPARSRASTHIVLKTSCLNGTYIVGAAVDVETVVVRRCRRRRRSRRSRRCRCRCRRPGRSDPRPRSACARTPRRRARRSGRRRVRRREQRGREGAGCRASRSSRGVTTRWFADGSSPGFAGGRPCDVERQHVVAAHRQRLHHAGRAHAGLSPRACSSRRSKNAMRFASSGYAGLRQRDLKREHALRRRSPDRRSSSLAKLRSSSVAPTSSTIDSATSDDEQRAAHPAAAGADGRAAAFLEHGADAGARRLPRGRQAEEDAVSERRDRARTRARVPSIVTSATRGMLPALSVWIGAIARYASSRPSAPPVDGQHEALGEHLARRAGAGRRRAPCESRSPSRAPTPARAAGSRRWRTRSARRRRRPRTASSSAGRIAPTICSCSPTTSADSLGAVVRILHGEPLGDRLHLDAGALDRRRRASSRPTTPRKCAAAARVGRIERNRPPELGRAMWESRSPAA